MKNTKTDYERILNEERGNNYGTQLRNKDLPLFNSMYHKWKLSHNLNVNYERRRNL
jgi:hypothetical protein